MDKKQLAKLIDVTFRLCGGKQTCILADRMMQLGFQFSTRAGISICLDDMKIPAHKSQLMADAEKQVAEIQQQYDEGLITDGVYGGLTLEDLETRTKQLIQDSQS